MTYGDLVAENDRLKRELDDVKLDLDEAERELDAVKFDLSRAEIDLGPYSRFDLDTLTRLEAELRQQVLHIGRTSLGPLPNLEAVLDALEHGSLKIVKAS